jgi:hypothetical protein
VQRRVDGPQVPGTARGDEPGDVPEVGLQQLVAEPLPVVGAGDVCEGTDRGDLGGDLGVRR